MPYMSQRGVLTNERPALTSGGIQALGIEVSIAKIVSSDWERRGVTHRSDVDDGDSVAIRLFVLNNSPVLRFCFTSASGFP